MLSLLGRGDLCHHLFHFLGGLHPAESSLSEKTAGPSFHAPPNPGASVLTMRPARPSPSKAYAAAANEGLVNAISSSATLLVAAILPAGLRGRSSPGPDLKDAIVLALLCRLQHHLDKATSGPAMPIRRTSWGARDAVRTDREAHWSASDVKNRMDFSLRLVLWPMATSLIRTHLDSLAPQHSISFEVFDEKCATNEGQDRLGGPSRSSMDGHGRCRLVRRPRRPWPRKTRRTRRCAADERRSPCSSTRCFSLATKVSIRPACRRNRRPGRGNAEGHCRSRSRNLFAGKVIRRPLLFSRVPR